MPRKRKPSTSQLMELRRHANELSAVAKSLATAAGVAAKFLGVADSPFTTPDDALDSCQVWMTECERLVHLITNDIR